ncbi:hypothetical protein N3K66_003980 [Trichothecium roseum]|uniref:Uncharacterized protein n=1 Tax=Trichothecium roseum TaxID=47278 RepID=A0ACC0V7A5_9HYPO|nr:hypothetical protein N3K66_003980 [Trichothecium roseum]
MHRPPSTSRFQEGSMRDRASAVPPVAFLDPSSHLHRTSTEGPWQKSNRNSSSSRPPTSHYQRPQTGDHLKQQLAGSFGSSGWSTKRVSKRGSKQFLGQVWDKLRGKKDRADVEMSDAAPMSGLDQQYPEKHPSGNMWMNREEIEANYADLMASGFFTARAIKSKRHPGTHAQSQAHMSPPQWPLSPVPSTPRSLTIAIQSPASAGSRGTKRQISPPTSPGADSTETPNKIRKVTAAISIPRLRSSMRSRRSLSSQTSAQKESKKLNRRTFSSATLTSPIRAAMGGPPVVPERSSSSRVLRSSKHGSLNGKGGVVVTPDERRGIPSVPAVPKWSYGEDRENVTPWRGLRIRASHLD